jgi:Sigma 54 modulation/S30EA ribosomal protein C terminus
VGADRSTGISPTITNSCARTRSAGSTASTPISPDIGEQIEARLAPFRWKAILDKKGPHRRTPGRSADTPGARAGAVPEGALAAFELPVTVNPQPAPRLTVEQAAERRGLLGLPFLFFLDAGHDRGSPLYHRHDGHYGLLTPQASLVMSLCPQERGRVVAASCCGGRAPVI